MKLSKQQHMYYDIVISALAFVAAFLSIIDLSEGMNSWQILLDDVILFVFVVDYVVRFCVAKNKGNFVRHNICDLIAILPFHTVFRVFKLVRFGKTLKLLKAPRIIAFLYRPLKKARLFFNTNGFKYVVLITAVMILTGGFLIQFAEGMSLSDGIWWAFVTATTVGYGDISPQTLYGRIIAMILMLLGIGLIGTVTSTITSYFLHSGTKKGVKNEILAEVKEKLDDFDALTEEDVDVICDLLKSLKKKS